jgi:death-on-curing protein
LPRGKPHYRITLADADRAHEYALTYGGTPGTLNVNLVASAIGRPHSGYYRSIQQKAAALLQSMAANHGYADGNKRTCLLLVHLLIDRSGFKLHSESDEDLNSSLEQLIVDAANRAVDFTDIHIWMKMHVVPSS